MVLDFMTVTAFFVLCAYKLLVKLLSMSSCVVNLHLGAEVAKTSTGVYDSYHVCTKKPINFKATK